jgi:hypothetical protein
MNSTAVEKKNVLCQRMEVFKKFKKSDFSSNSAQNKVLVWHLLVGSSLPIGHSSGSWIPFPWPGKAAPKFLSG